MQCPRCYYTNAPSTAVCEYCGAQLGASGPPASGGGSAGSKRKTVLGPTPGSAPAPVRRTPKPSRIDPKDPFRIAAEGIVAPTPVAPPPNPAPAPKAQQQVPEPEPAAVRRARPTMIIGTVSERPVLAGVALVIEADGSARSVVVREGRTRIGRRSDLEIVIPDPKASTEHALLRVENGEAWLLDTSANGTQVGGQLCLNDRATVLDGTVLRVGDTAIVVKLLSFECLAQLVADDL